MQNSRDLSENTPNRHRNLQKICWNLQKPSRSTPKIAEISLDLLESCRISPNLAWISPNIAGFVYNVGWVRWLGFWRRKPATRPAGVESWARKPVIGHQSGWFGRFPIRVQAVSNSSSGGLLRLVGFRVGLDTPSWLQWLAFLAKLALY